MEYYRPLPKFLTIEKSKIEGLGLFAAQNIKEGIDLGLSHIEDWNFPDNYIRTPLGGFINYSDTPNTCIKEYVGGYMHLWTIENIREGEELTLKYNLYNPTK